MTVKGAEVIAEELANNSFRGKVSFSGFGENYSTHNSLTL